MRSSLYLFSLLFSLADTELPHYRNDIRTNRKYFPECFRPCAVVSCLDSWPGANPQHQWFPVRVRLVPIHPTCRFTSAYWAQLLSLFIAGHRDFIIILKHHQSYKDNWLTILRAAMMTPLLHIYFEFHQSCPSSFKFALNDQSAVRQGHPRCVHIAVAMVCSFYLFRHPSCSSVLRGQIIHLPVDVALEREAVSSADTRAFLLLTSQCYERLRVQECSSNNLDVCILSK